MVFLIMDPINQWSRHKSSTSSSTCMRSRSGEVVMSAQHHPSTNLSRTRSQRDIQFPKLDPPTKVVSSSSPSSEQLSTRSTTPTLHFLKTCGVCRRSLGTGHDIYIYRGEIAFCSNECRELHMKHEINKGTYHLHH
ncbi:uncharacterized protein LOC121996269 [Zingiber officinale]|uniref:uncharacterized protein LOC121996269 n=1 Tax=Zingiber officinale TaxID=94328 RepID=UPI001C4CD475|nr:uncharacterized protein LOC121996269 [Zingiber officinale]